MFSLLSLLLRASSAAATIFYAGINESGGEFGAFGAKGTGLPGRFGTDYAFINEATVDTFVSEGVNFFRVTFLMERMCPLATGLGSTFNETHFGFYADAINYITNTKGAYALLDPHNYMRYNDPSQQPNSGSIIGDTSDPNAATTEQFAEFWGELAGRFRDNPRVVFGLNNEPHDMETGLILANNNAAIKAIRAAGADQLILAPGNGFTGGHSWNQTTCATCEPSSDFLFMLEDPIHNTAIDVHEYLDVDFSGSHQACVNPFPAQLSFLTSWLQQHNLKAVISEFGGDNNTECADDLRGAINYMAENDVYIGWTAWAAGPFWGPFSPCCTDGAEFGSLEPGIPAAGGGQPLFNTVWEPVIRPLLPNTLQHSGISSVNGPA